MTEKVFRIWLPEWSVISELRRCSARLTFWEEVGLYLKANSFPSLETSARTFHSFLQMDSILMRTPHSFLVTHSLTVYLWAFALSVRLPGRSEQSCCGGEREGSLTGTGRSIPSAWCSFLINHKTIFHYLGISGSMSLISIHALLKPQGCHPFWLRG